MRLFFVGTLILLGIMFNVNAQRLCGTPDYKLQVLASDPSLKDVFRKIDDQLATAPIVKKGNRAFRDTTTDEIIYIPVVIHLLYKNAEQNITRDQIISQLNALNKDFRRLNSDRINTPQAFRSVAADSRIQFCLAQVDPQGKRTSGIERKYTALDSFSTNDNMKMALKGGLAAWDSKRYLNIWICKLSNRCLGYATPPGAPADMDGVVIAYDVFGTMGNLRPVFNKGRTATHEIGHWLGLIHTWGDDKCGDDHVDDTPKQEFYNYGCPQFPHVSACSPDTNGDMFMNFMDFSNDDCMNMFTQGQVIRMRSLFAQNQLRNSFLGSTACDSTLTAAAPLKVSDTAKVPLPSAEMTLAKVYPSPVRTVMTIECKGLTTVTIKNMNIFNMVGMKVFSAALKKQKTLVDLSGLVAGIYIVQIGEGRDKFVTRIIKQ